jgi:hypothetical protein
LLPDNAEEIGTYLAGITPAGTAPLETGIVDALQGAIDYTSRTGDLSAAILLSSGAATECATHPPTLTLRAREGFSSSPAVPLFVIGFGDPNPLLDDIALAGGTFNRQSDGASAISQALDATRMASGSQCLFEVPVPRVFEKDEAVQVAIDTAAPSDPLELVSNLSACRSQLGYVISGPTSLVLCPSSCALVGSGADVVVTHGCPAP